MDYRHCTYRLPAAREDDVAAALWGLGALGFEVKDDPSPGFVRLEAYFPSDSETTRTVDAWRESDVERIHDSRLEEQDWLADYRAKSRPFTVGKRFFVVQGEPDDPLPPTPEGRILLRAPAQNAFGTGSHESTRLALRWLETLELSGKHLLDVGSGSGILAFAALKLGAASVVGFDLDPPSVATAALNARRNDCSPLFFAGLAGSLADSPVFDVLMVNVLPERILGDYPRLIRCLRPGGQVISSGNLLSRRDELVTSFAGLGLRPSGRLDEGEWTSFLLTPV